MKKFIKLLLLILVVSIVVVFVTKYYRDNTGIKSLLINNKNNELQTMISHKLKKALDDQMNHGADKFVKPDDIARVIIIYADKHGFNDQFAAMKIQIAAQNLGWESIIVRSEKSENALAKYKKLISFLNPDFTMNMHNLVAVEGIPNYLILHFPDKWLADTKLTPSDMYRNILDYDGFLLSFGDDRFIEPLQNYFTANNKEFIYDYFYFSVPGNNIEFKELDYKKLFFCGTRWDKRRGEDYDEFFNLLDKSGYFSAYGPKHSWKQYPKSYGGKLPFDHVILAEKMQESGIGLVLHNKDHYEQNIPSTRIFELSAASMMIISENMKFVEDMFGDNVLYINPSLPPKELFLDIDKHMQWIKDNPLKAREMAKNANQIFQENFVLENLLLNVEKMHMKLLQKKRIQ